VTSIQRAADPRQRRGGGLLDRGGGFHPGLGRGQPLVELVEGGDAAGDAVLARSRVVAGLGRGAHPHHAVALRRRPGRLAGVPHLVGIAQAGTGPSGRLDPVRLVVDDPVPKRVVFLARCGQHRHEPAPVAVDVAHGVAGGQLAVGDVAEIRAAQQRDQLIPGLDMGDVVAGVAVDHAVRDRHRPIGGHGQDPHQLLEVRAVILVVPERDRRGGLPAAGPPVRARIPAGDGDAGGVVVQLRAVDPEPGHRVEHQPGQQRGAVRVEQPGQHPPHPVVVEQLRLALGQPQRARVERLGPPPQRVHRLPRQHQVAHQHPDRRRRGQSQPRIIMRYNRFQ
jgi:hypothetical protein